MLSKIREKFAEFLFDTIVHINVKLKESAVMGQTVVNYDKYCRGSKDYFSLAKEIISKTEPREVMGQLATSETKMREEEVVETQPQEATEVSFRQGKVQEPEFTDFSEKMQALVKEGARDLLQITFSLDAPEARSVYVTGSFNDWSLDEKCRMKFENGRWVVNLDLKPGLYKYQFIVDGRWREDPANPRQERNSFGDINSLLEVKSDGQS
jgi:hypothetical protein